MSSTGAQDRSGDGGPSEGRDAAVVGQVRTRQLARLGALFAGFAHEIRNPLSTIGLNLQLVKEDFGDAENSRDARMLRRITVVEGEVKRLQAILEQFLGFVRVPKLQLASMRVENLLEDLVEFFQPETGAKGVGLRLMSEGEVSEVSIDADQMRAVLVNLLRNALDACSEGDQILMSVRSGQDGDVLIQVMDSGEGMDEEAQTEAFSPYFSTKKGGTGLGLPTARRIVEQHGGGIELSSEPGQGTQFTIRLPAGEASAQAGDEDS